MTLNSAGFTPEGGKFHLAEALFDAHKYSIPCPSCPTVRGKPGFIKDQAGRSPKDGLSRRMWKCQHSNARGSAVDCPRKTCTEYINLARRKLDGDRFIAVVRTLLRRELPPAYSQLVGSYLGSHVVVPDSQPASSSTLMSLSSSSDPESISISEKFPDTIKPREKRPVAEGWEEPPSKRERLQTEIPDWPTALDLLRQSVTQAIELTIQRWGELYELAPVILSPVSPPSKGEPKSSTPDGPQDTSELARDFQQSTSTEDRNAIRRRVKALGGKREFEAQLKRQRQQQHQSSNPPKTDRLT
ncbi:MAG: hypothetical protein Q9224_006374 [Gallowayella concinna]